MKIFSVQKSTKLKPNSSTVLTWCPNGHKPNVPVLSAWPARRWRMKAAKSRRLAESWPHLTIRSTSLVEKGLGGADLSYRNFLYGIPGLFVYSSLHIVQVDLYFACIKLRCYRRYIKHCQLQTYLLPGYGSHKLPQTGQVVPSDGGEKPCKHSVNKLLCFLAGTHFR